MTTRAVKWKPKFLSGVYTVSDTASNLVAANAVYPEGQLVVATDTNVIAFGDGATSYNSLPKYRESLEPVRADTTTQQGTVNSGTPVDRTDLASISFVVGTVAWDVEYYEAYIKLTTVGSTQAITQIVITDAANAIKSDASLSMVNTANSLAVCRAFEHITTPGNYTRKGRVARVGTSAVLQYGQGAATSVSWIEARPTGKAL